MTGAAEWPARGLDVAALLATGWRPVPIREFVLKLVGRCNLACDYCYVYQSADQSWRTKPAAMAATTLAQVSHRITEHARAHRLDRVRVVLHGGEPLLAGVDTINLVAETLRRRLTGVAALDLHTQTNALLLDERFLAAMHAHDIRVGVSLDGGPDSHDRHRRSAGGRGSFEETAQRLRLLGRPEHRALFSGLLCVVDLRNDPIEVYESLLGFDPPAIDLLLPHGNWSAPPPGRRTGASETPYGDWLIAVFDHWFGARPPGPRVRLFEDVIRLLLGRRSGSEQVGLGPAAFLVIDTDGGLEQTDTLKSSFPGAPETGLNVFTDPIDAALSHPSVVARQIGLSALAPECTGCGIVRVCGGGHYGHRYRRGTGFRHPSVYCPDLIRLIRHVQRRVAAGLPGVRR